MSDFLKKIREIESSGGKNTNHKRMPAGIHQGTSAVGDYGIMPNTALETLNRMRLSSELPEDYQRYLNTSPEEMEDALRTNPELYNSVAEYNANRALERTDGDEEKAAYMWNQGLNLNPDNIDDDILNSAQYVQKFRKLKDVLKNSK